MSYNKEEVKENLELEDVFNLLDFLGADPQIFGNHITCLTICHGGDSHKLYYYENTQLFKCFSGECGTFDIFELVSKLKNMDLNQSIYFMVNFFNLQSKLEVIEEDFSEDWKILKAYNKIDEINPSSSDILTLPEYDLSILKYYPRPRYYNWEKEGISKEVCDHMDICFDPIGGNILIPHRDQNGRCVGIRQRTLIQEQEQFGKYRPWKKGKQLFNSPLAFNLYGLNEAKDNIRRMQTAIVVEAEKSVLKYMSYFGLANNICVAVCGGSLSKYQFRLLQECGAKEIVIAFDKDFEEIGSEDYYKVIDKLQKLYDKYSTSANISFLFDKECNQLGYKDSPLDCGPDKFLYLFRNRVVI